MAGLLVLVAHDGWTPPGTSLCSPGRARRGLLARAIVAAERPRLQRRLECPGSPVQFGRPAVSAVSPAPAGRRLIRASIQSLGRGPFCQRNGQLVAVQLVAAKLVDVQEINIDKVRGLRVERTRMNRDLLGLLRGIQDKASKQTDRGSGR